MCQEKICCIYAIESIAGNPNKIGWKNIGQTDDYTRRLPRHFYDLKRGKHHSPKLQRYYNKYGRGVFAHYILKICPKNELNFWEMFFVKCFDSKNSGFNCNDGGQTSKKPGKKCVMQHIYDKRIEKYDAINIFADKYHLSRGQVSLVISGKRNHVGEWFCPKNKWRPKFYRIFSSCRKQYNIFNVRQFCREQNISQRGFLGMLHGQCFSYKGWRLNKEKRTPFTQGMGKQREFKLLSPVGKVVKRINITKFAQEFNLPMESIRKVIRGHVKNYKNWTLCKDI